MLTSMVGAIRILGIDPGLNATGWGVIVQDGARLRHVAHGVIKAPSKESMAVRLCFIFEAVEQLLVDHQPHEAAVEDQFVSANPGTALKLGQARAAAILAPARAGLIVGEYAPRLVKKAVVGTGAAEKSQVAAMISILLPGAKAEADAADALAVAICHANHRANHRISRKAAS
jgi:crossover junction endodeoxyribonuclease RuvC